MKFTKKPLTLLMLLAATIFSLYLYGCKDSVTTEETDDEFIKSVIINGYGQSGANAEEDDIMGNEVNDLDDGGAVPDMDGLDTPIDSLIKWGRRISSISKTVTITNEGDTIKYATITTNITGTYFIIGVVNSVVDTIAKPYTEEFKRIAWFKRVARNPRPRFNWRLYKVSMLDGETKTPQIGTQYVQMNKLEVYVNGTLAYTFMGPDFTQNIFTTRFFGGAGIPEVNRNDQVKIIVYTFSTQSEPDIVAWHWGKRNFGFHREPFLMTSNNPNGGGWDRTYEKTFNIHNGHHVGRFNGCISASTHKSLWDDSPAEFASDIVGTPYRVRP